MADRPTGPQTSAGRQLPTRSDLASHGMGRNILAGDDQAIAGETPTPEAGPLESARTQDKYGRAQRETFKGARHELDAHNGSEEAGDNAGSTGRGGSGR